MSGGVKSKKKVVIVVVFALIFLLLAGVGAWLLISKASDHSPFSKTFMNSVNFPLYYPAPLPTGYTLNKKSVVSDGNAVNYELVNEAKKITIIFTLQPTPANFDAAKIIGTASIPNSIVSSGTIYNLSIGGTSKYMFTTGDGTLIFITSTMTVPTSDINHIANNLQEVQ